MFTVNQDLTLTQFEFKFSCSDLALIAEAIIVWSPSKDSGIVKLRSSKIAFPPIVEFQRHFIVVNLV